MSGWAPDCVWCASLVHVGSQEAMFRVVRGPAGEMVLDPWVVESWKTSPDSKFTDFTLRKGIQFHKGFGELTADDLVWNWNLINVATNKESRHDTGGQFGGVLDKPAVAIDKYTFRFEWSSFAAHTLMKSFTDLEEGVGFFSKRAFDEKGIEWMKTNYTGTGPFEMMRWVENEVIELAAFERHWAKVPYLARVRILQVPESAARRTMLEVGQAHAGDIPLADRPTMVGKGFKLVPESSFLPVWIEFGGNYWEKEHMFTGAPLERVRDTSKPWIGNPYETGADFNPNAPSMQRALKVRQALSMAIDRKTINEVLLKGLGEPNYLGYVFNNDPIWQENKARWTLPYDPAKAKQLLNEAGYAAGLTVEWYVGPDPGIGVEVAEAVAADWLGKLNVKTVFDRQHYTSFRPMLVARTMRELFGGCCYGPLAWPFEWTSNTSTFPAGYNAGIEFPISAKNFKVKNSTTDPAVAKKAAVETLDFMHQWYLWTGVVQWPAAAVYNPKLVEWERMRPYLWQRIGGMRSFEWAKLK